MAHCNHPRAELSDLLARIPLFSELSGEHLTQIAAATREVKLRRGDIICQAGENPAGFHYVLEGKVKLSILSLDGSEKVIDIVGPGMSFGEALMFVEKPCPVYAQAVEETALLYIGQKAVLEALDRCPPLARHMLAGLSQRLHHLIADVETYCLQPAGQRIIGYLLKEAEAARVTELPVSIMLPVSKALLASRLNVTPETLSRVLNCLSQDGLITVKGRVILVHDVERLRTCGPIASARFRACPT